MSTQVTVTPSGHDLEILLQDANGATASFRLNRQESFVLLAEVLHFLNPHAPDAEPPLHLQEPALRLVDPAFDVGLLENGHTVLAIKGDDLPSLEFYFSKAAVSDLIDGLKGAAVIPASTKSKN